jgi:5'-nucleotidase
MKRRTFIQNISLFSGAFFVPNFFQAATTISSRKSTLLTILHTNDTHSNIDPFPSNHSKFPGFGGVARRFAIIEKIRKENEHVLLLDAGDIFQGTPYFNKFKGKVEMKAMSLMKYDVATLGNHDFDIGLQGFLDAKKEAEFEFVNCNYNFKNTLLDGAIAPYKIIEKGGVKIGVFGIGIELEGLVPKENFLEIKYLDPIEQANLQAEKLKSLGCELIICLSHLGYAYNTNKVSDLKLAAQTKNVDIIIGGHTHTFLEQPTRVSNLDGEMVTINQVGWGGIQLGRIDVEISSNRQFLCKNQSIK